MSTESESVYDERAVGVLQRQIKDGTLRYADFPDSIRALIKADPLHPAAVTFEHAGDADDIAAYIVEGIKEWQRSRGLVADGIVGPKTLSRFVEYRRPLFRFGNQRYVPHDVSAQGLFRAAANWAGLPEDFGTAHGLHEILRRESDGWVGRPNYTYGDLSRIENRDKWPDVWAELKAGVIRTRSTALGLGQLIRGNMIRYSPEGVYGYGDSLSEAVAMLRYIVARYKTPALAWQFYNLPVDRDKSKGYSWRSIEAGFKPGEGY